MLKESTYKDKFEMLGEYWTRQIIEAIKKDLKNEHLKRNFGFVQENFETKNLNKLGGDEMARVYHRLVVGGDEGIGEYLANRWLLKHSDAYELFERELFQLNPQFTELTEIEPVAANGIMQRAIEAVGPVTTYLFCVLNSVVFPDSIYRELEALARKQQREEAVEAVAESEARTLEQLQEQHERTTARLIDRYEKKLSGLEKKYAQDVDALKRQVASLQRKLAEIGKI